MFEQIVNKIVQTGRRHGWLKPFVLISLMALFGGRALGRAIVRLMKAACERCGLRRAVSLALAACVAFTLFPAAAFADGADNPPNGLPPAAVTITAFEPLAPEIAEQTLTASAEAVPALPESLSAQTAEGSVTVGGVSWAEEPAFTPEIKGDYTFTAVLPEGYLPNEGVKLPVIRVTVTAAEEETPPLQAPPSPRNGPEGYSVTVSTKPVGDAFYYGDDDVFLVAGVTSSGTAVTTGRVQFYDSDTKLGSPVSYTSSSGFGKLKGFSLAVIIGPTSFSDPNLLAGSHTIKAEYIPADSSVGHVFSDEIHLTVSDKKAGAKYISAITLQDPVIYSGQADGAIAAQFSVANNGGDEGITAEHFVITATRDGAAYKNFTTECNDSKNTVFIRVKETGTFVFTATLDETTGYAGALSTDEIVVMLEPEATWHLTSGNTDGSGTLQQAFAACNGDAVGGEIILQKTVRPNYVLTVNHGKKITLKSADGQQYTIQRPGANYSFSIIVCGDKNLHSGTENAVLRLENIIIDGGAVWADGKTPAEGAENTGFKQTQAAISVGDSLILGEGAVVQNNDASTPAGVGGGIHMSTNDSSLRMEGNAKIINNRGREGGGIHCRTGAKIELLGTAEISGNAASEYDGGGILYECSYFVLTPPTANSITLSEGASIQNNTAERGGGGIYFYGGTEDVGRITMTDNAEISDNYAYGDGGGINLQRGSELTLSGNTKIEGNGTDAAGGGILNCDSTVILDGESSVADNTSSWDGGGIYAFTYFQDSCSVTLKGSACVKNNRADNSDEYLRGGGIYISDGMLLLSGSACVGGNISNGGGGVYAYDSAVTLQGDSVVSDNTASGDDSDGGGIYFEGEKDFKITENAVVTGNKATGSNNNDGGGIYLYGSLTVDGSAQITGNIASGCGGGIYSFGGVYNESTSALDPYQLTVGGNSKVSGNQAVDMGGGIYSNARLDLKDSASITGNSSGGEGGGAYFQYSSGLSFTLSQNPTVNNNTMADAANNLALSCPITLGAMGPTANVGFHLPPEAAQAGLVFATGTGLGESDANAFFYDSGGFGVGPKVGGTGLLLTDRLIPATAITGSAMSVRMKSPLTLRASVTPQNASSRFIAWNLKDAGTTGATVENGIFTAQSAGTATVTAKVTNGDGSVVSRDFTVTVIPAYEVSGTVIDHEGNPVPGATVTVVQGQTVFSTSESQSDGSFTLTGVPDGVYNLVVTSSELTVTQIITIAGASQSVGTVALPQYRQNTVVEITGDVPNLVIGGLNEQYGTPVTDNAKGVTQEDLDKLPAGGSIDITCKVNEVTPNSTEDDEAIHAAASKKGLNARLFVDIQVIKTVTAAGASPVKTALDEVPELLTVRIPLPAELQGKIGYTLYRIHGGEVDEITTAANSDGEKIEIVDGGTFLLAHLRKFSTYAIACKNPPSPSYSGGSVSSEFYVTVIAGPNGKANTPEGFYARDEKHTFTVIPDKGYVIDTVTLDDGSLLSHTDTQFILLVDEPYEVHVTFRKAAAAPAPAPSKNPQTGGTETGAPWLLLLLGMGGLVLARRLRESEI